MRRRLYSLLQHTRSARPVRDEHLLARIKDSRIHVMTKKGLPVDGGTGYRLITVPPLRRADEIKQSLATHRPEPTTPGIEATVLTVP